ncbi:MAG TPA: hypothetical protein VI321_01090 [Burkholderiales bacterium]
MAEHNDPHGLQDAAAIGPENFLPPEKTDLLHQIGVRALHDGAAFVEDREQVAQPPAGASFARDLLRVQGVDARFRARKSEPCERVEEIVQAPGPCCDASGFVDPDLVIALVRSGAHEAHLAAALRAHPRFFGETIETIERRFAPRIQPLGPRPDRVEDGVG